MEKMLSFLLILAINSVHAGVEWKIRYKNNTNSSVEVKINEKDSSCFYYGDLKNKVTLAPFDEKTMQVEEKNHLGCNGTFYATHTLKINFKWDGNDKSISLIGDYSNPPLSCPSLKLIDSEGNEFSKQKNEDTWDCISATYSYTRGSVWIGSWGDVGGEFSVYRLS